MIADANEKTKSERRKEAITAVVEAREKARGMTRRWMKKKICEEERDGSQFWSSRRLQTEQRRSVHLASPEDELLFGSERVDLESSS